MMHPEWNVMSINRVRHGHMIDVIIKLVNLPGFMKMVREPTPSERRRVALGRRALERLGNEAPPRGPVQWLDMDHLRSAGGTDGEEGAERAEGFQYQGGS